MSIICKPIFYFISVFFVLSACHELTGPFSPKSSNEDELLDGPVEGLSTSQNKLFLLGDVAFNDEVFSSETGLGPMFVAASCGSCHAGDGKGHPFTTLVRFGQTDTTGNTFLDQGGPQLQNRALPGFDPEQIPTNATHSKFTPPANTGVGFLEFVTDTDLLAMSDPDDTNGDGISGVPNWNHIPEYVSPNPNALKMGSRYICRFGKKGATFNLMQQTARAYNQDMGITSLFEPIDTHTGLEIDAEVSTATVNNVVFYLQTLKAPIQRNAENAEVNLGKQVFINIGCEKCHKQTLKTGFSPISALSEKEFHPYTDLLLHDMGAGLDDGYTEGSARTSEWRTPALWGLGLSKNSQGGRYFLLHDGRATSLEQAILLHGGEGERAKGAFSSISVTEKKQLITFLESL